MLVSGTSNSLPSHPALNRSKYWMLKHWWLPESPCALILQSLLVFVVAVVCLFFAVKLLLAGGNIWRMSLVWTMPLIQWELCFLEIRVEFWDKDLISGIYAVAIFQVNNCLMQETWYFSSWGFPKLWKSSD